MTTFFFGSVITFLYFLAKRWRKKPTHEGEWEIDYQHLPRIELRTEEAVMKNVRDWRYGLNGETLSGDMCADTVRYDELVRAWVVVEPFMLAQKIAHTFLTFELRDGRAYAVSIEARRKKKQGFRPFRALFREYELMYQWGTERDLLSIRALRRKNALHMMSLKFTQKQIESLFKELAMKTNELFDHPRFYNTLFANCTTELFDPLASIHTRYQLPFRSRVLTGTVLDALEEHDLIDTDAPWTRDENIAERIQGLSGKVLAHLDPSVFSRALRSEIRVQ